VCDKAQPLSPRRWTVVLNIVELMSNETKKHSKMTDWIDSWLSLLKPKTFRLPRFFLAAPSSKDADDDQSQQRKANQAFRLLCIRLLNPETCEKSVESRPVPFEINDHAEDRTKFGSPESLIPHGLLEEDDLMLNPEALPFVPKRRSISLNQIPRFISSAFEINDPGSTTTQRKMNSVGNEITTRPKARSSNFERKFPSPSYGNGKDHFADAKEREVAEAIQGLHHRVGFNVNAVPFIPRSGTRKNSKSHSNKK